MNRPPPPSEERLGPSLHLDYHLTPETPIHLGGARYQRETRLDVDVHEGIEVGIVLTGAQERRFGDYAYVATSGDVWLCATWEPHGWRALVPATSDVLMVFLPTFLGDEMFGGISWLALFAVPPSSRPRVTDAEQRELMLRISRDLHTEAQRERAGWDTVVRLDLLRVLASLSRGWSPPPIPPATRPVGPHNLRRIIPVLRLVHSRPTRKVTLAEAAGACNLSRARFCSLFRRAMGISFGEFCVQARLGVVAKLLLNSAASTHLIAEQMDFTDASHLHRSFLKHYGCTPGEFRVQGQPPH
jgi:AraC-like DNA-binding protein